MAGGVGWEAGAHSLHCLSRCMPRLERRIGVGDVPAHSAPRLAAWLLCALSLIACSREPRWTLWETRGNQATKNESGLERQVCEMLRERAERNEQEVVELFARLDRQLVAVGGKPEPNTRLPITYRCRRDGE